MECNGLMYVKNMDFNQISESKKIQTLGINLQQVNNNFREVVLEFQQLKVESENFKSKYLTLKEQRKSCMNCPALVEKISVKDKTIALIAAHITKLEETKNLAIIKDILKVICGGDISKPVTPESDKQSPSFTERSKDELQSDIENTPTGRISPIISTKKCKNRIVIENKEVSTKKKCSNSWPISESKLVKLTFPSTLTTTPRGKGKLKQSRLNLVRDRPSHVVDLTSSTELKKLSENNVIKIKKESLDNDDTILPSPTSNPAHTNFTHLYSSNNTKNSPCNTKTPVEVQVQAEIDETMLMDKVKNDSDVTHMEDSINLFRFPETPKRNQMKVEVKTVTADQPDDNTTHFETNVSLSIIEQVDQLEKNVNKNKSPTKFPLAENLNLTNIPSQNDIESSISLLRRDPRLIKADSDVEMNNKKRASENVEPLFKEPTVRKKAEKRALPGWSCEECKNFYSIRYKDNEEMLSRMMDECSKHRGRHNPARPATPPGYWQTRWQVPEHTEAFNERNDAV